MSKVIVDAEMVVTKPSGPSFTIPNVDIINASISERAQDAMSSGEFEIHNNDAEYIESNNKRITSGDKIVFKTQLEDEKSLSTRWTALVRDVSDSLIGGTRKRVSFSATDFVFTILSWRLAYDSFEGEDVGSILNSLVADQAPAVGRGQIRTIGKTADLFLNGRTIFDALTEDLQPFGDAIVRQDGTDLVFEGLANVTVKHDLTPDDLRGDISVDRVDDRIENRIRVDGGTDHAVDDEQLTQSNSQTVTDTSRITHQVQARKSEIARVQLYTITDGGSSDGIRVRLQADRNGSPVDVSDQQSDIASKLIAEPFLADDGFTTFLMPNHSLAPKENPWLIIEADGSNGHNIGTDGGGTPTFKAEYPFPLLARTETKASQQEYRRRDGRVKDDSIDTFDGVRDMAQSRARHRATPESKIGGAAETARAHNLETGEIVLTSDWPVNVADEYLCLERTTNYDGGTNRLSTSLTLQDVDSL